jgi:hypothetical protein
LGYESIRFGVNERFTLIDLWIKKSQMENEYPEERATALRDEKH